MQISQERFHRQEAQLKQVQLDQCLVRPDISAIAKSFDEQAGKPGSFKLAVAQIGELAWHRSGGKVNLSPDEAIQMLIQQRNLVAPQQTPGQKPGGQSAGGNAPKKKLCIDQQIRFRMSKGDRQVPENQSSQVNRRSEKVGGRGSKTRLIKGN